MKKCLHLFAILLAGALLAPSAGAEYLALADYYGSASNDTYNPGSIATAGSTAAVEGVIADGDGSNVYYNMAWLYSFGWTQIQQAVGEAGSTGEGSTVPGLDTAVVTTPEDVAGELGSTVPDEEDVLTTNDPPAGSVVPEPGTVLLLGTGLAGVLCSVRRARQK